MKEHKVVIGGREFPLAFTLNTMIKLQEEYPDFDFANIDDAIRKPKGFVDMLYRLAVSGAALEDRQLDVDRDWMADRIPPSKKAIEKIGAEVAGTMKDWTFMETEKMENEGREIDVTLEKIKKNEEKTD